MCCCVQGSCEANRNLKPSGEVLGIWARAVVAQIFWEVHASRVLRPLGQDTEPCKTLRALIPQLRRATPNGRQRSFVHLFARRSMERWMVWSLENLAEASTTQQDLVNLRTHQKVRCIWWRFPATFGERRWLGSLVNPSWCVHLLLPGPWEEARAKKKPSLS